MKLNFLNIEEQPFKKTFIRILPVRYQGTVSYVSGTAEGPDAILAASAQVEKFSCLLEKDLSSIPFYVADPVTPDLNTPKHMMKKIHKKAAKLIEPGKILCTLGGEHSISGPVVQAHADVLKEDFDVIVIDAHLDLHDEYQGTNFSHATVSRRLADTRKVCVIGARSICENEFQYVKKNPDRVFHIKPFADILYELDTVLDKLNCNVYLSIDADGFDPSVFPSTGTPVAGGLSFHLGMKIFQKIVAEKNVIGLDFMEMIPDRFYRHSDFTAAQMLADLFGMIYYKDPDQSGHSF